MRPFKTYEERFNPSEVNPSQAMYGSFAAKRTFNVSLLSHLHAVKGWLLESIEHHNHTTMVFIAEDEHVQQLSSRDSSTACSTGAASSFCGIVMRTGTN